MNDKHIEKLRIVSGEEFGRGDGARPVLLFDPAGDPLSSPRTQVFEIADVFLPAGTPLDTPIADRIFEGIPLDSDGNGSLFSSGFLLGSFLWDFRKRQEYSVCIELENPASGFDAFQFCFIIPQDAPFGAGNNISWNSNTTMYWLKDSWPNSGASYIENQAQDLQDILSLSGNGGAPEAHEAKFNVVLYIANGSGGSPMLLENDMHILTARAELTTF